MISGIQRDACLLSPSRVTHTPMNGRRARLRFSLNRIDCRVVFLDRERIPRCCGWLSVSALHRLLCLTIFEYILHLAGRVLS